MSSEVEDLEALKTEALKKLGRNVINFSKIEAGLKILLTVSELEGDFTNMSSKIQERRDKLRKQTLGLLVSQFNERVVSSEKLAPETELEPKDSEVLVTFKISLDNRASLKSWQNRFASLVKERNALIHQKLASFDFNSSENCRDLIEFLDRQNVEILASLEEVKWFIESIRQSFDGFRTFLKDYKSEMIGEQSVSDE